MKTYMKTAFALVAVALMVMVAAVPMATAFTNNVAGADADSKVIDGVEDLKIQVFNKGDDYSDMVYFGENLPVGLDPAEWMRCPSGYPNTTYNWYNINAESEYYGTYLRVGQTGLQDWEVEEMQITETEGDVITFPFVQVTFFQTEKIAETTDQYTFEQIDGVPGDDGEYTNYTWGAEWNMWRFEPASVLFDRPECGIFDYAADKWNAGNYRVTVKINGETVEKNFVVGEGKTLAGPAITSANSTSSSPIYLPNVSVSYKITVDGESITGTAITADDGTYNIVAPYGSRLEITNVALKGFTFNDVTYKIGVVSEDSVISKVYKSVEKVATVSVKNANTSVMNISEIEISAAWYYLADGGKIETSVPADTNAGKCTVISKTDADGNAIIAYVEPTTKSLSNDASTFKLFVKANDGNNYTFAKTEIKGLTDWPTKLEKGCAFMSSDGPTVLVAKEYSATLPITAGSAEGASISDATIKLANWYYQTTNDDNTYTISTNAPNYVTAGRAKIVEKNTIIYELPIETIDEEHPTKIWAFYLYASAGDSSFTFEIDKITPSTKSTTSIEQQVTTQHGGATIAVTGGETSTEGRTSLWSTSSEFCVSGTVTITGDDVKSLIGKELTINYTDGVGSKTTAVIQKTNSEATVTATYAFPVKSGSAPVVTVSLTGYTFNEWVCPTSITENTTVNFTGTANPTPEPVSTPTIPYDADGLAKITFPTETRTALAEEGAIICVTYVVDFKSYTIYFPAKQPYADPSSNADSNYWPRLIPGSSELQDLEIITAEIPGYNVGEFVLNTTGELEAKVTGGKILPVLFFYDKDGNVTYDNLVGSGETIIVYDSEERYFGTFVTDDNGAIYLNIDDTQSVDDFAFYYGAFKIDITDVSGVAAGNLYNYMPAPPGPVVLSVTVNMVYKTTIGINQEIQKTSVKVNVGKDVTMSKINFDGYKFVGFIGADGKVVSDVDSITYKATAEDALGDGVTLTALYEIVPTPTPENGIDSTTLILGIIAIVIAVIAVAYVIIQTVRKN